MCIHSKTTITQQTHTHTVLYVLWQVCSCSVCVWAEQGCGLRLYSCLSMARRVGPTLWRLWSCPTSYLTCTITPVASPKTCFIGKEIFFFSLLLAQWGKVLIKTPVRWVWKAKLLQLLHSNANYTQENANVQRRISQDIAHYLCLIYFNVEGKVELKPLFTLEYMGNNCLLCCTFAPLGEQEGCSHGFD